MVKWTPEIEEMWRCRFRESKNPRQPFREYVSLVSKLEMEEAFSAALDELKRLRQELSYYEKMQNDAASDWSIDP
jgi:hypothetical protein